MTYPQRPRMVLAGLDTPDAPRWWLRVGTDTYVDAALAPNTLPVRVHASRLRIPAVDWAVDIGDPRAIVEVRNAQLVYD